MATTEQLKVKITADASQAKAEIGKFKDSLKGTVSDGEAVSKSINKMTAALGTLAVTLKTVKALVKNGIDVAAQGDAIKDNAQKVFMNTTAYQEWGYVLKQNGIEIGSLKTAMRKFSQEVAAGSPALAKYGITATDVNTAFEQAVYTIQNMTNETDRIAAATELFGSRALELMPMLNMTNAETQNLMATYRALGGTMSNELIAASDTCTDSITAMKAAWGGLRNVLAAYVLPIVTKVVQWITVAIAYVRILLSAILGIKSTFGGTNKKTSLPSTTGAVATNTGNTAKNLGKANKAAKELKRTLMGIDELTKLVEQATSSGGTSPSGGGGGGGSIPSVGDVGSFDGIISDETLEKIQKFQEKVESIKGFLNGSYQILKGLVEISLGNFTKGWADLKEGIGKVWDNLKELFPWIGKVEKAWGTLKDTIKDITADIKAKVATKWADIKDAWNKLISNVKDKVAEMKAKVATKWSDIKDKWNSVVGNIKDKTANMKAKVVTKWSDIKSKWNSIVSHIKDVKAKLSATIKLPKISWEKKTKTIGPVSIDYPWPSVKWMAKGGVLTAPTAAVMGEYAGARNNPEIVTPQGIMYETMQKANGDMVSAFADMTRQVIAAIEGKDLSVRIGDETIARSAQRGNTAYYNRTGRALLTI